MTVLYGIIVVSWIIMFAGLFFEQEPPNKFTVGCAYLIVIITFLESFIEGVAG